MLLALDLARPRRREVWGEAEARGDDGRGVLVKIPPALKAEMAAEAKRLGLDGIAEYVRELHRRQAGKGPS